MKSPIITLSLFLFLSLSSFARNVMTWIPPYGTGNCKSLMNNTSTSKWLKNGLSHIGLQFWVPGDNGDVVFVTNYQYQYKAATISQDVQDFVAWGNSNNVKVMLCIYNTHGGNFDWNYVKNVIDNYPTETVTSIMNIVNTYGLDGVDIDFEGVGSFGGDKNAYVSFLNKLGTALHNAGKELSVDIFSTPCYNAPNPSWESSIAPNVDFINIMGYEDTYEDNNTLFQYCPETPSETNTYPFKYSYIQNYLTVKQGVASSKLNYGLTSEVASWGDKCIQEHILDIMNISSASGIAIWDLQLSGGGLWKDSITWDLIARFKNNETSSQVRSDLLICGIATSIEDNKVEVSPLYYDSYNKLVKLSGNEGELMLYSSTGVLISAYSVKAGEDVSLNELGNGVYIIKFNCKRGVFSKGVCLFN